MAHDPGPGRSHDRWAQVRFAVVGPLLAAPPAKGELQGALDALAEKTWLHPMTHEPVRFAFSTVERWYYQAKNARTDPVGRLRRRVRKDAGEQPAVGERLRQALASQHEDHPTWSYKLHADNLAVLVEGDALLGPMPSYSTVLRYMKAKGLLKRKRLGPRGRPGVLRAEARRERREVRSYEAEYVHGLWHSDYHRGSLKVVLADGQWRGPLLLAFLDDRSRLCGHAQWYLADGEAAEDFVHGLCQAIQKRGLPRALMTDNGSAMGAAETQQGLERLGIVFEPTLSHSPYQNGKQEVFWAQVEGRLLAMLEGAASELTLALLNQATQAWVELEYNRKTHSETGETPLARFLRGPDVGRPSPSSDALRAAFTLEETRSQRRSDGSITVEGVRYEVPARYAHLERVAIRYARWDLSYVLLVDARTAQVLTRLYPVDRAKNADGARRALTPPLVVESTPPKAGVAPLLERLMTTYARTGLPPAYLPKNDSRTTEDPR